MVILVRYDLVDRRRGEEQAAVVIVGLDHGFDDLDAPVARVCNEDVPLPYAAKLEKAAIIDVPRILAAVRKTCNR